MRLTDLMTEELPINRKESFYTHTVFPMIVCRDNFRHFAQLTSLIPGYNELIKEQHIRSDPNDTNIQFFTEYSLVHTLSPKWAAKRDSCAPVPKRKVTPDIVILVAGQPKVLIAIEAKMFGNPDVNALKRQMDSQAELLRYIRCCLNIDEAAQFHVALVPENTKHYIKKCGYPLIFWREVHNNFLRVIGDDYWLSLLRLAITGWDDLVSRPVDYSDGSMTGKEIYDSLVNHDSEVRLVCRSRGLKGFREDVEQGAWKERPYKIRFKDEIPTDNWFRIEDFISCINATTGD